jgi:DNA-binding transcriptional ArsR family regulator
MAAAAKKAKTKEPSPKTKTICDALKHPIRVRILEVLCEGDISPVQFLRRGCLPPGFDFEGEEKNAISHVSYHFKVLREADCIVVIETIPRRGASEHIYRSKALALHTDEDFEAMGFEERRAISRSTLQTLLARADSAIYQGTFDKRVDRHLSWVSMELDEEGWKELRDLQAGSLESAQAIKAAAIARKHERSEQGDTVPTFPATFGALGFESPTVPGFG